MLNIILVVATLGFLILFFLFRNKYLKVTKELEGANMLLKRWNVHYKEKVLIEKKQKRKIKN